MLLAAVALTGCEPALPNASAPPAAPDPRIVDLQRRLERPFVVFAEGRLEVDRLGEPVAAPVTVGSHPSQDTMSSDAPDVVSVEPDGRLLAHRAGTARVRSATGGRELLVVVSNTSRVGVAQVVIATQDEPSPVLSVTPARIRLRPGQVQAFEARSQRGAVPVSWSTSNDQVLAHLQDHVFQAVEVGGARVCAVAGKVRACAGVEVTP